MERSRRKRVAEAASLMKLTAKDLYERHIIDHIIDEDLKGATVESYEVYRQIKEYLNTNLKELQKLSTSQLINKRYEKYRKIGQVF